MMASRLTAIPILAALLLVSLQAQDIEAQARALVTDLLARQFDKVVAQFDETMTEVMPASKLGATLDAVVAQAGALRAIQGTRVQEAQGYRIVFVTCEFEKLSLDIRLPYDAKGRVAGMFFAQSQPAVEWTAPEYARQNSFREKDIVISSGNWTLPGTLTLPQGDGPFPAVVLVHGSGPNDQDETLGPNKPFKDLAWGLAGRGVAVLRYTKRTRRMAELKQPAPARFTVMDETVDDAVAAVALLAGTAEIDSRRIYVLGHSLGGMLAPRIAAGSKNVAGLIIMAGSTRPLEESVLDQLRYLATLPGANGEGAARQIPAAERAAQEIRNPELSPAATIDLLGAKISGSYFLSLRDYSPAATAAGLKIPMLILQGGRDYQVTTKDFEGWKSALEGHAGITFKLYPALTHLFMPGASPGAGLGTPEDYQKPAHVDAAMISDIAAWILNRASKTMPRPETRMARIQSVPSVSLPAIRV